MGAAEAGDGFYGADLAYVHDAGFGDFARGAADGIIAALRTPGSCAPPHSTSTSRPAPP